jgi:hypothetical protein
MVRPTLVPDMLEYQSLTTEQEWSQEFRPQAAQMVQKSQTLSFFGRRSFVPRPMSEATEIFDTDNEDENTDDGSGPRSMGSVRRLTLLLMERH